MAEEVRLRETVLPLVALLILLAGSAWVVTTFNIEPVIAGILVVETIAFVWLANWLRRRGILRKQDMPYFYVGIFAVLLLSWGLIASGIVPIIGAGGAVPMDKFFVYAITSAALLGLFILSVALGAVAIIAIRRKVI